MKALEAIRKARKAIASTDLENKLVYVTSDFFQFQSRMRRKLRECTELLDEGLIAHERDKPHVVKDRMERALMRLQDELEKLKLKDSE